MTRRCVLALLIACAWPATADARTVAHRTSAAGPVFAGDLVAWGEAPRDAGNGPVRVMVGAPGRAPLLVHRIGPATARRTRHIVVRDAGRAVTIPAGHGSRLRDVALTGRYVAWIGANEEDLVVYDLQRRAAVSHVRATALGARVIDALALQADGTVAFGYGRSVGWAQAGLPGVHVLARHTGGFLALAGGRALYTHVLAPFGFEYDLMLRSLSGGRARRLAHLGPRAELVGDVDLDSTRAAWAVQRSKPGGDRRGQARIVVRGL